MGIYIMDKGILEHIPPDMPFGFDDLVMSLLAKQIPINVFPYDGFWLDIGRPEDYDLANNELLNRINEIVGNAVAI
jgi:NDP-sugar pyrophosphorylase family protein